MKEKMYVCSNDFIIIYFEDKFHFVSYYVSG